MKPLAPSFSQSRTYWQDAEVLISATPLSTGTRPDAIFTISDIRVRFSDGSRVWFSPSEPAMIKPLTPEAINASQCFEVASMSRDISWRNCVVTAGKTPVQACLDMRNS